MKRGGPSHPKTVGLAARLKLRRYAAAGLLECLWHFAGTYARRGDIGRFSDAELAAHLDYDGDPEEMVAALVEARLVDRCECHRLRIHDWPDHADQAVHKTKEVATQGFLPCYASGVPPDMSGGMIKKDGGPPAVRTPVPATATAQVNGNGTGNRASANPLLAGRRDERVRRGELLARSIADHEDRDPTEVVAQHAHYEGARGIKTNLATMTDDRLAATVISMEKRWREISMAQDQGDAEEIVARAARRREVADQLPQKPGETAESHRARIDAALDELAGGP